jgi:hypothetical protein
MLKYFNSQALGWGLSRDFIKNRNVTRLFYGIFASEREIFDAANAGKLTAEERASGVG